MQALKGLVAGLGVLIVIAMTTIGYGLYRKADDPDFKFFSLGGETKSQETDQPPALPTPSSVNTATPNMKPMAFGDVMLSLPKGCVISNVSGDGTRIFLKIGPSGPACERVLVVDAANGSLLGTLKVAP